MLNQLKNLGLTENEAKVYLAMLELGPAPVLQIASKAGINRPTTYFQIEALKKLGLVSHQNKGHKQLFVAESPDQLEIILSQQAKQLEQKQEELRDILPQLSTLYDLAEEKPVVRYFEGTEGVMAIQNILLKSGFKEVLSIMNRDAVLNSLPNHPVNYTPLRVKKKIKLKQIYTTNKGNIIESDPKLLREVRRIDYKSFAFDCELTIYGNSVSIETYKGKITGIILTHPDITNSFKSVFNLLWEAAKK